MPEQGALRGIGGGIVLTASDGDQRAFQYIVTLYCPIKCYNFLMDDEPSLEIRFYRAAYNVVSWLLYAVFYIAVIAAAYFSFLAFGGFALFIFISGVALLRLYFDIKMIKQGAVDLPAEYQEIEEDEERKQLFRKSGRG